MTVTGEIKPIDTRVPFLLKVVVILTLVYGIMGTLFYATMLIYQLFDRNFLIDWEYNGFEGVTIIFFLIMQAGLHGGLVLSGVQLIKLKRSGFYIFALSYFLLTAISFLMGYEYGWINTFIGLFVFVMLLIYLKKLT